LKAKVRRGVVRDLARGGDAVCKTEQGLVFARGGLPGETVELSGIRRAGKIFRGRVTQVLEPSEERETPECSHWEACGGCPWMHASARLQQEAKSGFVRQPLAKLSPEVQVKWHGAPARLGYRRRARLAWVVSRKQQRLGYRRARSADVVDIPQCVILREPLAEGLNWIRERVLPRLSGCGELQIYLGRDTRPVALLDTQDLQSPELFAALAEGAGDDGAFAGIGLKTTEGGAYAIWGDLIEEVPHPAGGSLDGTVGGFSQANDAVNAELYAVVMQMASARGCRVLELYCGHGNFTVGLASEARFVRAIEWSEEAARACQANLADRELNATVVAGRAEHFADSSGFDVVVLDPPRTGAKEILEAILRGKPERIVYVSCDTATLSRDLRTLVQGGYRVAEAHAFDMFPGTAHVETCVLLVKA